MRVTLLVATQMLALCESFKAYPERRHRLGLERRGVVETRENDIAVAFQQVKDAALLFAEGSSERLTADSIVAKLSSAHFDTWKADDMELLDSCLLDDSQQACVAFVQAMTTLRELHESSPGNA